MKEKLYILGKLKTGNLLSPNERNKLLRRYNSLTKK